MKSMTRISLIVATAGLLTCSAMALPPETASLYKAKCNACHGPDGTGTPIGKKNGVKNFSTPEVMKMTDAQLTESVMKGKNKMPAFKDKLKESEITDLIAYVRELGKKK